jgi:hypothetical protein
MIARAAWDSPAASPPFSEIKTKMKKAQIKPRVTA